MTLQFRPYQADAIDAIDAEFEKVDSTLLVASVGAGKTIIQAGFIQRIIDSFPDARFVCAVHTRELVAQNYAALIRAWPFAPAGVNSAALGSRDTRSQILFCSIQSVHRNAKAIGWCDCLIVDEAHLISPTGTTMYQQFIRELREINPDMRILGMSGTPFRMDMGMLTDGDEPLFQSIAYEVGVAKLIEDGYLTRPISRGTATTFDVTGVHTRGGDYIAGELERAVDKDEVTEAAVREIIKHGHDRKAWIAFAAGVDHAAHIRDEMRRQGVSCEMVEGSMSGADRKRIIEDYKAGRIRCLTNVNVLSIGFDYPAIDLIALMRPTKSPALYIQQVGRGLRLSPGKETCLILDFANVVRTLGPIDNVQIKKPGKGAGDAPIRMCPQCECINHAAAKVCIDCGFEFPEPEKDNIKAKPDDAPLLSTEKPWHPVRLRRFYHNPGKEGRRDTVKVSYVAGLNSVNQWLCASHDQGTVPKNIADKFWLQHGGQRPFPSSVHEWLERQDELLPTKEVQLSYDRNPKYPDVKAYRVGEREPANDNVPVAANDNERAARRKSLAQDWEMDADIPF